ncbi:IS256 family transposase [Youngiibacter multivorans]|uniref:Mutator family transposase n=1 Tax=Youngiibacter multivorans TaxID=937251 RepID=A0ABS4G9C2_9CLOT|nr:IS256 family transposase [Youngiibacter multivorans]MBP1921017.1 transposase-like protein [Youngiibacter multivorans]
MAKIKRDPRLMELAKQFLEIYDPTTADDVYDGLKEMLGGTIESMLESEMDDHLGYPKGVNVNHPENTRNGFSKKTVKSTGGPIEVNIPRDRKGEFDPKVVGKYKTDISDIEEKIISMYAKGMTTRDIEDHVQDIYGFSISASQISTITDKIIPMINEWQTRPLESVYPVVFMDAIHYHVRQDGVIVKKAVYNILGYTMDGTKDILGMWIGENESSKFWLSVLNELKNRGVQDILIACIDGLTGFKEAINAVFGKTKIQRCIIHQIRSSTRYVSYKDIKALMADLKLVYKAPTEKAASVNLDKFEEKWKTKYPACVKSWRINWPELSAFFEYPAELRTLIYTTNAIEGYHRQLRKVTKTKTVFPTDTAVIKILYLATMDVMSKWTQRIRNWDKIESQIEILFENRLNPQK